MHGQATSWWQTIQPASHTAAYILPNCDSTSICSSLQTAYQAPTVTSVLSAVAGLQQTLLCNLPASASNQHPDAACAPTDPTALDFSFSDSTSHPLAPLWVSVNSVMCDGIGFTAESMPPSPPAPLAPPMPPSANTVNQTTLIGSQDQTNLLAVFSITGTNLCVPHPIRSCKLMHAWAECITDAVWC